MLAVDTNVVVRLLTADEPDQYRRAVWLFANEAIWLSVTVVMEVEWVLRHAYRFDRRQVTAALASVIELSNVAVEQPARVHSALAWFGEGMDFADALHLAAADRCEAFVSFDRALVAMAGRDGIGRAAREP